MTTNTSDVVSAIRELTTTKQLERTELLDLLKDGLHAALVKRYGPNVRAEIGIDELKGTIRIAVLRTVVEAVEDPGSQVTLEEARFEDSDFQVGDVLEEDVPFEAFGRTAVQAAKQRIIQRVREGERARIREEFSDKVGELLSGEVQQIERGKIVVMLAKFREAEAIIPYREQNHREHFHQGDTIRAVLKRIEETPKGPRLILSRAYSRTPRPRRSRRSWTRTSCRSPSGATGRTSGSPPSSPAGRSTSIRAASGWSAAGKGRCSLRSPRRTTRPRPRSRYAS